MPMPMSARRARRLALTPFLASAPPWLGRLRRHRGAAPEAVGAMQQSRQSLGTSGVAATTRLFGSPFAGFNGTGLLR